MLGMIVPFIRNIVALVLLAAMLPACGDPPPDARIALTARAEASCRAHLEEGAYADAVQAARLVIDDANLLALDHPVTDQARFCFVMARSLRDLDETSTKVEEFISAVSGLVGRSGASPTDWATLFRTQTAGLDQILTALIEPVVFLLETNLEHLDAIAAADRLQWSIERLPVRVAQNELFDAGGNYDSGELRFMQSFTRFLLGTLYLLQGTSFSVNLPALTAYGNVPDSPLENYAEHPVASVLNLLAVMLGTDPNFLAVRGDEGKELIGRAGTTFTAGFDALLSSIAFMKERPAQADNHIFYVEEFERNDHLVIAVEFKEDPFASVDLHKFDHITIPLYNDILNGLARIRDSLAGKPDVMAHLQRDVFPVVAAVSVFVLGSGAIDAAIDDILSDLDPGLADEIRSTLEVVKLQQEYFMAALLTAVPMDVALDLSKLFREPVGIRAVMPAWIQPASPGTDVLSMAAFTEATFVISYECENPLWSVPIQYLCEGPEDQGHFAEAGDEHALPWRNDPRFDNFGPRWAGAIPPDGIKSRFPYIGFKDPTFGGILYIDPRRIHPLMNLYPELEEDGLRPATQLILNATLANIALTFETLYSF
jgi:hypothetical protein